MSESSGPAVSGAVILEEPEGGGGTAGREQPSPPEPGPLRCGSCALWPRQQTWLCVVPLLIGFIGLGLSLMLLKWIVVGSVKDYVPTDLVDAKGIGQDPIFLSKPSAFPKNADTATTSTTTTTAPGRTHPGAHSTTAAAATTTGGSLTPRPPNRISTRITTTTTTRAPRLVPSGGREVTPRSTTVRKVTTGSGRSSTPSSGPVNTAMAEVPTSTPSPSGRFYLHDSTPNWLDRLPAESSPAAPTRPQAPVKTPAPTYPPEHSEHFKPCRDKDLAYCLNEGECFVIETLTGSHKHCRCKEGYQGVRCDQFLPKTDSILSDPTDHLGIEFMESEEVYKRQVLSISCIAIGISLLGTLCVAFYCRNKRQREKLQAHLKESRSLKSYSANMSGLMSKTSLRPQCGLQLQSYCKGHGSSSTLGGGVRESSFSQSRAAPPCHSRVPATGKPHRSSSLSHSPDQRSRPIHRSAPRRTPPLTRGRLNPIGGTRDSGPAYQHLQEVELSEREAETQRGNQSARAGSDPSQDIFLNMQPPLFAPVGVGEAKTEVQCSRLGRAAPDSIKGTPFRHATLPPPVRACSIPIIPSVLGQDDISCMQKGDISEGSCSSMPLPCLLSSVVDSAHGAHTPPSPAAVIMAGGQQEAVALLLEAAQEQLRVLAHAHRKLDDSSPSPMMACETACFLSPITAGGVPQPSPPETQLMNPSEPHRDSSQPCQ